MGNKRALHEVDPFSLPVGLKVGPWRVKGWRGRGAYSALYCVAHEGREGEFALKLAIHPGDERFGREAELLRRIASPHVPRFREQGVWEHPAGPFPYVVMQLVEGEPLYAWASRRNPTSCQVARLADLKPPCKEEGKDDAYLWKGACYGPVYPPGREPTSNPP